MYAGLYDMMIMMRYMLKMYLLSLYSLVEDIRYVWVFHNYMECFKDIVSHSACFSRVCVHVANK